MTDAAASDEISACSSREFRNTEKMSIPSGTVTLLFSDIEGSTHLWEQSPQAMATALERHDELVRRAMDAHGGYVFKTIGDAFCVAFETGHDALRAALDTQVALHAESWPPGAEIRVRIALHTGVCQERDGDYFGPTVNRTARLMATAHGGQVVVSGVTFELLSDFPPDEGLLRDLGQHRLRDLGRPEHVWQLAIAPDPIGIPAAAVARQPRTARTTCPSCSPRSSAARRSSTRYARRSTRTGS